MAQLTWDDPGTRLYETGVDRGVLYMPSGVGVPWNGLISIDEQVTGNSQDPLYFDGVKYADIVVPGDFAASVKAYTYPESMKYFEGVVEIGNGMFVTNQSPTRFGMSYRTRIGNDEGGDHGYKIHVLYNLLAFPSAKSYGTLNESESPIEFQWDMTAIPSEVPGFMPSAHLIFDSTKMSPDLLADIEQTLYGDEITPANLPPINIFASFIGQWVLIRITDNLDGTWSAEGPDSLVQMLDSETFQIIQANAVYLTDDIYSISDLSR